MREEKWRMGTDYVCGKRKHESSYGQSLPGTPGLLRNMAEVAHKTFRASFSRVCNTVPSSGRSGNETRLGLDFEIRE